MIHVKCFLTFFKTRIFKPSHRERTDRSRPKEIVCLLQILNKMKIISILQTISGTESVVLK